MYTLIKTLVLDKAPGSQYHYIEANDMLVSDLYRNYLKAYLEISSPVLENNIYVDLDTVRDTWIAWSGTVAEKLVDLGDTTIPSVAQVPSTKLRYAKYMDAVQAGYKIDLTTIGLADTTGYPRSVLQDAKMWRPKLNTDITLLDTHALISVNGLIHDTDTDGKFTYLRNAGASLHHSRHNQVGIWSFLDVGRIHRIRLKPENIRSAPDATLKDRAYIDVPDVDLTNRSYMLILGGYVVLADGKGFHRNGERQFSLDLKSLPYESRLQESASYIRLDSLPLTRAVDNIMQYTTDSIWSDDTIRAYLTLSQSFLVIIDTPNLMFDRLYVRTTGLPGKLISYQEPSYPLLVGYGKMAEYWRHYEDGQWSLSIQDGYYRNYLMHSVPAHLRTISDPMLNNHYPMRHSDAYMLMMAGYD